MQSTHSRRGIAATEFALWLPFMMALIAGVIDWGAYMNTRAGVTRAVIDGVRVGAAQFESSTDAPGSVAEPAASRRAQDVLDSLGLGTGSFTITARFCPRNTTGPCDIIGGGGVGVPPPVDSLLVRIRYDFEPWFGFAFTPAAIRSEFVMAMENQRAGP